MDFLQVFIWLWFAFWFGAGMCALIYAQVLDHRSAHPRPRKDYWTEYFSQTGDEIYCTFCGTNFLPEQAMEHGLGVCTMKDVYRF